VGSFLGFSKNSADGGICCYCLMCVRKDFGVCVSGSSSTDEREAVVVVVVVVVGEKGEVGTGVRFADDCGPGSSGWRDL
jgi:hypothetical protein